MSCLMNQVNKRVNLKKFKIYSRLFCLVGLGVFVIHQYINAVTTLPVFYPLFEWRPEED